MTSPTNGPKAGRVQIRDVQILADHWGVLSKYEIDFTRADGTTQGLTRETYHRGEIADAKTIMLLQHAALKGLCRLL